MIKDALAIGLLALLLYGFVALGEWDRKRVAACEARGGFMHESVCLDRSIRK